MQTNPVCTRKLLVARREHAKVSLHPVFSRALQYKRYHWPVLIKYEFCYLVSHNFGCTVYKKISFVKEYSAEKIVMDFLFF